MNIKRIITILLVFVMMTMPFHGFALEIPNVNMNNEEVTIKGNIESNKDVNIIVEKEDKRYFMDTVVSNDQGEYSFHTILPINMDFDGKVNTDHEKVDFKISTKKQSENTNSSNNNTNVEKYVTLSVDLLTINKGYLIRSDKVKLKDGDTVWSVLKRELDDRNISCKYTFSSKYGSVYVQSIAGEGEFDHGAKSGWMYEVNGTYPDYGASQYRLKDGDVIRWRYTTNLGQDLGTTSLGGGYLDNKEGKKISIEKGNNPVINIPNKDNETYVIKLEKEHQKVEDMIIHIPACKSVVSLDCKEVKNKLPNMHIYYNKEEASLFIPKDTVIKIGNEKIELFSSIDQTSKKLKDNISKILKDGEKLIKIDKAFKMGHKESIIFDREVTLRFKDCAKKSAAFIEKDKVYDIKMYDNEEAGKANRESKDKYEYAYYDKNDLVVKTNHFTDYIVYTKEGDKQLNEELSYIDQDHISDWALEAIKEATKIKLVNGDEKNAFHPKDNITRAEFTTIITKMLNLDINVDQAISFKDVKKEEWFYPYVNAAYQENIIKGFGEEFKPNDFITREQMAAIISNALKLKKSKINESIKDMNDVSDWAKVDVSTVFDHKIIVGYNQEFHPKDQATREMAVVVCINALKMK